MFATFPVKSRTPTYESFNRPSPPSPNPKMRREPRPVPVFEPFDFKSPPSPGRKPKRDNRNAKVYVSPSPTSLPARPTTARTQPERPAPVLELPGLPPKELPRSVVDPTKNVVQENKWINAGKNWLAQFKSSVFKTLPAIPPYTPKEEECVDDPQPTPKRNYYDDFNDPPPLYRKTQPEGGLIAWASVAGAFMIQFCTVGYMFTWDVFEDHYNHVFLTDQNPIGVRFIGSVQWFLAFLLSIVAGKLADSGYFRHTVVSGSLLFSLCLFLLSLVGEEEVGKVFACQALGMGVGIGLVFVPTALVSLNYFKRKSGFTVGIVMSGGSFGGMIFPPVLRGLLRQRSFGGAVRATAYIILVSLVIANCLIMINPPKTPKTFYPLPRIDLAKYSNDLSYLLAAAGTFLTMLVIYFPATYLDLLGLERGVDPKTAFTSIVVLSFFGLVGRIGLGFASDIYGSWNILMPVSGLLALMLFVMCTVQGPKSLAAFSMFYGVLSSAWLSLMFTSLASLSCKSSDIGTRVGLVVSFSSFAILFSGLLQYAMLTPQRSWKNPSIVAGFLFLAVTGLSVLSRNIFANRKAAGTRRRIRHFQLL